MTETLYKEESYKIICLYFYILKESIYGVKKCGFNETVKTKTATMESPLHFSVNCIK